MPTAAVSAPTTKNAFAPSVQPNKAARIHAIAANMVTTKHHPAMRVLTPGSADSRIIRHHQDSAHARRGKPKRCGGIGDRHATGHRGAQQAIAQAAQVSSGDTRGGHGIIGGRRSAALQGMKCRYFVPRDGFAQVSIVSTVTP
jgi:hypothetical protein